MFNAIASTAQIKCGLRMYGCNYVGKHIDGNKELEQEHWMASSEMFIKNTVSKLFKR